jgi:hypothetical protein
MIKIPHRYYTFVYSQPSIAKTAKPLLWWDFNIIYIPTRINEKDIA